MLTQKWLYTINIDAGSRAREKYKMLIRALIIALLFSAPATAFATGCHLKTPNAILCTDPDSAADFFQAFGSDIARTNESYNRELMRQSGCTRPYGNAYATVEIEEINHGRVATPSGWVPISIIEVNHKDIWYVASDYLDGTCKKFVPSVSSIPLDK